MGRTKKVFKVSFNDFLEETGLMTNEQAGFYLRLLYWFERLGPLPVDRLMRMADHYNIEWQEVRGVLDKFEKGSDGLYGLPGAKPPKNNKWKQPASDYVVILPWATTIFAEAWEGWKGYKKAQHAFTYKDPRSEQATLNKLFKDCGGIEAEAIAAIEHSIACTYKGIYKNKDNGQASNQTGGRQRPDSAESMQAIFNQLNGGIK